MNLKLLQFSFKRARRASAFRFTVLALALACVRGNSAIIVADKFNVTGNGSGFALNSGINSGINPPATRLTGSAAANLRYINTGTKDPSAITITSSAVRVDSAANPGRFVLSSDGSTSFNFANALGTGAASPSNPVVYDLAITIKNNSSGSQRCSFAIGTAEGDAFSWDFGVQVYRSSGDSFYTIGKRVDTKASGLGNDLNSAITTLTPNSYGEDLYILMRVTDAGSESSGFNSRVQLSLNNGVSWFYDTTKDNDLTNGWRFNGAGRHIMFDVAPNAGPVTYDDFSVTLNPPASYAKIGAVFRVMTYNIHWAAGPDGKVNTQRIANYIIQQDVDLICLNEVPRNWSARASGRDIIGELAKQTGMSFVFSNNNTELTGNAQLGNGILSKFPVMFRDHRLLPRVGDNEQRGWLKAIVDVNGKFVSFWTTHLDFHANNNERLRCGTNFNNWIADETFPVIFGGDFNDTPNTPIYDLMEQKWLDIWPIAGNGTLGRTVPCPPDPVDGLRARIDYIWKGQNSRVTPTNAFVGYALEASDHYSVLADFALLNFTTHAAGFYFGFDEGSGTKTTDSVAGLIGSFASGGPSWSTDSPSGLAGDFSLFFNGSKKILITDTNQIIGTNGVNENFTVQAWVKLPIGYAPSQPAVLFQYERRPGFAFCVNTNRGLLLSVMGQRDIYSNGTIPNDGQWHHVAAVHTDGTNVKFFIDTTGAGTTTYRKGAGNGAAAYLTLGADSSGANGFVGNLDRVSFDQEALTSSEFDFPAVPPLGIRKNGDLLTVFWRPGKTGYGLESNSALQPGGWSSINAQQVGEEKQATIFPTNAIRFYRLKRQ